MYVVNSQNGLEFLFRPSRNGSDHNEGFFPGRHGIGKRGVGWFVGEVFFAGKEAQEGTALLGDMVADGAAQHGITGLERVQYRALRDWVLDFERHLSADVCQVSEMVGKDYANHINSHLLFQLPRGGRYRPARRSKAPHALPGLALRLRAGQDRGVRIYVSVCTSTESTAGRSRTIGFQLSPESAEQYTWPPVVPK
jgi:hypothetical protein